MGNLWQAWNLAQAYNQRPSDLYNVEGSYASLCFDTAVATLGRTLEQALEKAASDAKTERSAKSRQAKVLSKYLGIKPKYREPKGPTAKTG
jgi:hypothetical protein